MSEITISISDPDLHLVKSIEEIYFVCLFSILCFGQKVIGFYREGSESCLTYDHPSGSPSFKCTDGFKFEILNDTNLNTLAIYGTPKNNSFLNRDKLCFLSFKHLILKDLKLLGLRQWENYGENCSKISQSLTMINVKFTWDPNIFNFYHIYVERSDLSSADSVNALNLPDQLRSLSLVSCLIQFLPPGIFANIKSLQMLTITRNSLKDFSPNAFSYNIMESLWSLDLSFNQINHIPDSVIKYFPNLAEINLQSNHIQILPEQPFFKKWIEIDIVNLDANALICDKLRWSADFKPHPIFFDSAACNTNEFLPIPIGLLQIYETV